MGRMKNLLIQRMDESDEEQLAHKLGLTYDELTQLNHKVDTEESEDGVVYNYYYFLRPGISKRNFIKNKRTGCLKFSLAITLGI